MGRRFISLLLVLSQLSFGSPTRAWAEPGMLSTADAELTFHRHLDEQAQAFLETFQKELPEVQREPTAKVFRAVLLKSKELFDVKKLVLQNRTGAAVGYAAGSVFKYFILPSVLIATGHGGPAMALTAIPFATIGMGVGAQAQRWLRKRNLKRDFPGVTLAELDAIRDEILGYDLRERISSALLKVAEGEVEHAFPVELVRKIKDGARSIAPVLEVADLERLVGSQLKGRILLDAIAGERGSSSALYAVKLLEYVQHDPELLKQALVRARSRLAETRVLNAEDRAFRANLLKLQDLRTEMELSLAQLSEQAKALDRAIKGSGDPAGVRSDLKQFIKGRRQAVSEMSDALVRAEYLYLSERVDPLVFADFDALYAGLKFEVFEAGRITDEVTRLAASVSSASPLELGRGVRGLMSGDCISFFSTVF